MTGEVVITILVVSWAIWFVKGLVNYKLNGEGRVDERLRQISR